MKRSEEEERVEGRGYFTHTYTQKKKKSVFTLVTCMQYEKKNFEVLKIICINFLSPATSVMYNYISLFPVSDYKRPTL